MTVADMMFTLDDGRSGPVASWQFGTEDAARFSGCNDANSITTGGTTGPVVLKKCKIKYKNKREDELELPAEF